MLTFCSICNRPAHASETDDFDRCAECLKPLTVGELEGLALAAHALADFVALPKPEDAIKLRALAERALRAKLVIETCEVCGGISQGHTCCPPEGQP